MSVKKAAMTGDRLATLRTLRDDLAGAIDRCESMRDLAALAARLQSVMDEITRLEPAQAKGDVVDEIAKRRAARRASAASGSARAKRSG